MLRRKTVEEKLFRLMDEENMTIFQVIDVIVSANEFSPTQIKDFRKMVDDYLHYKWKEANQENDVHAA